MNKTPAIIFALVLVLSGCATPGAVSKPTAVDTIAPTPSPRPSSTPSGEPGTKEHSSEDAGVRFQSPTRFSVREYPEEQAIAIELTHDPATIYVMSRLRLSPSIEEETDSAIELFCENLPPCKVLEREAATLGGEPAEMLVIQYTDGAIPGHWRGAEGTARRRSNQCHRVLMRLARPFASLRVTVVACLTT
jgi:hypothetical protein